MMKKNTIADNGCYSVIALYLQNLWPIILLIAIFCLAVMVRLDSLPRWIEEPDRAFYGGEPLLPSVDGYYYLSLSQDLLDGTYEPVNRMRGIPDSPLRPIPAPLLSWMGYIVAKYSGLSLNWVALLLPAMLGSLIVFPMYGYGKKFNGRFMGVCSALFAALAGSYVLRTRVGAYDTDCLIITLALCIGLFFWNASTAGNLLRRVGNFIAALLSTVLLYFWWEQTPDVVFVMSAAFCCIGLIFFYRPSFKEGCVFYGVLCGVLLVFPLYQGVGVYAEIFGKISSMFTYIVIDGSSLYPNIGGSITEQQIHTFEKIVEQTTVTYHVFVLSVCGLLGLLIKRKKDIVILSVFIAIGLLGVFYASRFLIFLTPVLALGLGFFLSEFWMSPSKLYRLVGIVFFFLLAVVYHFYATNNIVTWPYGNKNETHALIQIKEQTPDDAVIWSTWGKGYRINYWARRATISDGANHSGKLSHYLYWPLAQENMRFSANFIKFFSMRGQRGIAEFRRRTGLNEEDALKLIHEILSENPAKAQSLCNNLSGYSYKNKEQNVFDYFSFFFPVSSRPVYLFLHQRMLFSSWWYWYGTWDITKQEGVQASYAFYSDFMSGANDILYSVFGFRLELQSGDFCGTQLAEVYDFKDGLLSKRSFSDGERIMYVKRAFHAAVLMDEELWDSVFNRLFIRYDPDSKYFAPFYTDAFNVQVWKVK